MIFLILLQIALFLGFIFTFFRFCIFLIFDIIIFSSEPMKEITVLFLVLIGLLVSMAFTQGLIISQSLKNGTTITQKELK